MINRLLHYFLIFHIKEMHLNSKRHKKKHLEDIHFGKERRLIGLIRMI